MSKRFQLIAGGSFFALMFLFAGINVYEKFFLLRSAPGWLGMPQEGRVIVEMIRAGGPATALRIGDEVLAINGQRVENVFQIEAFFRGIEEGFSYNVLVQRRSQSLLVPLRTGRISFLNRINLGMQRVIIPAIFLLTGLAVLLLRFGDKQATLLALMFGSTVPLFNQSWFNQSPVWLNLLLAAAAIMSDLLGPLFLHFFLIFPEEQGRLSPILRRFPRFERWLYLPVLLLVMPPSVIYFLLLIFSPARATVLLKLLWLERISWFFMGTYLVCGLASLLVNYRQASDAAKRKMRVVVVGSLIGLLPMMFLFTASVFSEMMPFSQTAWRWIATITTFAFPLFPLSFAYAIIRYKLIPVSFILRRGVRYLFVSQGSLAVEIIAVALAVNLLLWGILTYVATLNIWVVGILSALDAILVWNITSELHRRVIAPAIDRRFFRESYNAQQVLAELGQSLRTMTDKRKMTAQATEKIQAALHTENTLIFLRDEATGDYVCTGETWQAEDASRTEQTRNNQFINTDRNADRKLRLPHGAYTIARFREASQPLTMDLDDPKSWAHALIMPKGLWHPVRQRESETLRQIRPALMLPISTRDQLHGVISLGPRLGDLPFSREDRHLLTNVALQIAFAIENAQLVERKVEEERLHRELLMATEVQQRLFPKCAPDLASLDLCGVCHPARGVAGDYYDFIMLDPARVGIAVADVAGKGMAAALLMSTVQASLRSQARIASGDPTELVATMNQLLFSSTDTSSYATFFYAQFDELTRRICYVNAGHNPPILWRAGAGRAMREAGLRRNLSRESFTVTTAIEMDVDECDTFSLTTGGPVIGLLEDCVYDCETIPLEIGDILVAYTDGITEAFSPSGEEFGEERLRNLIVENATLSASDISARIMQAIADWCRDTPPHDDQTLVVMKVR